MADQNINHFSQYAENPFEKYAHPEKPDPRDSQSDFMTGLKDTFKQLPELGWGIAAITASGIESISGEGGLASAAKNFSVNKYKGWQDEIAATHKDAYDFDKAYEKAKGGDFGALVDFLQYGVGYAVGQGAQVLATAGVGKVIGQLALRPAVESMAAGLVAKQAAKLAGEGASAEAISAATPAAIKSIAGTMGQHAAMAAYSFGMEGGEIGGDLAQKSVSENRALSGNELMRGLGATFLAGTMEYGENVLSLAGMKGKIPSPFGATAGAGGRVGRAATGALVAAPVEGVTEYGQTIAEEYGKGNEQTLNPFAISDATHKQGINAAALGVIGGTVHAGGGGMLSSPTPANVPSPADATPPLQIPHLPDRPLIVFPDGSVATQQQADQDRADGFKHAASPVVQAPDVDSAIVAAQDSVKIPVGSFGEMSDFADLIKRNSDDISRRRQSISDEAELNAFKAQEKSRIDADYARAEQQRRDADIPKAIDQMQNQSVDSTNELIRAQGFDEPYSTAMQIAMDRAQRVALERELLKQQKAASAIVEPENGQHVAVALVDPVAQPIKESAAPAEPSPELADLIEKYSEAKASGDDASMRAMAPKINELTGKSAVAQRPAATAPLSIGTAPNSAEPITVKNGIVHIGKYPAQNFDSGEDVSVPDGATPTQIRDALKSAGAIGSHQKIFGLPTAEKQTGGGNRKAIDPSADPLFVAIAKMGGISTSELTSNGIDLKDITREVTGSVSKKTGGLGKSKRVPISLGFGMPLHKKSGMSFDGVLEKLKQYGYFHESATKNDVINAFNKELSGDHHYAPVAQEKMAEQDAEEYDAHMRAEQDRIDAETAVEQSAMDEIGYDELSHAEQRTIDVLGDFDIDAPGAAQDEAAAMRAMGFSEEEINDELRRNEESARADEDNPQGQAQRNVSEGDASGSGESFSLAPGENQGSEAGWLTSPTRADLLAQQDRAESAAKADAKAATDAANKDKADAERNEFTLTGSDRVADVGAARGQKDIFSSDAVAETKSILDAANVTGKERLDVIKDLKSGNLTAEEVKEAYPVKENRKSAVSQIPTRLNEQKLRMLELEAAHEADMFYDKYPWASRKTAEEYAAMWSRSARDQMRDIANTSRELAAMEDSGIVPAGDLDFLDPMPLSEAIAYSKQRIADAKKRMEDYRQKAIDAIDEWNKYVTNNPEVAKAAGIEVNLDTANIKEPGADYENAYETDIFGRPLPETGGKNRAAKSGGKRVHRNAQSAGALQDTNSPEGEYYTRTIIGTESNREIGASRIVAPAHAAQATAYLNKSAVERFDGIVTDKNHKPLAVIGGFKGAVTQASVYPSTIMGEAIRVAGAAHVWFSHNHPSGVSSLSGADVALNRALSDVFLGSGIEPMGLMAVAGSRFSYIDASGNTHPEESIPPSTSKITVPVITREIAESDPLHKIINPIIAKATAKAFWEKAKGPGIILLNAQHFVIGWVPISKEMMGPLRGTGGAASVYRAISYCNASAAIIVHGGELDASVSNVSPISVSENIGAALNLVDVRPIDSINVITGQSAAESWLDIAKGPMFSRGIIKPMSNSNDVVGNQGGRSADDTTPGTVKESEIPEVADGFDRMHHSGSDPIKGGYFKETPSGGVFDGFFALVGGWGNYGTGQKYFADIPKSKVLSSYDLEYALDYETVKNALKKAMPYGSEDDFDSIWKSVIEDQSHKVDGDDLMRIFKEDTVGEASWEAQRIRGNVAKALGYQAIEMDDENGTSYLIVSGVPVTRVLSENESTAPDSGGAFSRGKDRAQSKQADAHSAESLTSALSGLFGGKWLVRLLKSGKFRIVTADEAAEISGDATNDEHGNPLAFYHPDGVTYLIADNIPKTATKKQLAGLMRHELGVHALNAGRDSAGWHKIIKQIDVMRQAGNPAVRAAWQRAEDSGTAPQNMLEETAGYLVEEGNTSIARRIIAWFKEAVYKLTGYQIQLTDGDVVAMAQSALRSAPEKLAMNERKPSGNARFSNAKSDDSLNALFSRSKIIGQTTRQHTPAQLQAMRNVGFQVEVPTLKERAQVLWKDAGKKLAQGLVDQFAPVKEISKEAYGLLRLSKGASGAFEALLKGGQLKLTDNVYAFDETKRGGVIDKLLIPLGGEHHDFFRWVAANRAERLKSDEKEHLFSEDDIKALKTLSDGTSEFDYTIQNGANAGKVTRDRTRIYGDALITFNTFNKNVMDMAEQSGLIDKDSRHLWENEFYVPFYREADEKDGGVRGMNIKGGVVRQEAFKKLKGGTDKLNADLLDNTLMNWAHLLDAAAKNRAATATLKAMEGMGSAQRVAGSAEEYNASKGAMLQPGTKQTVWFMEGGKKAEYKVDDPYLMAAISSLEYAGMRGGIMDVMSKFKHALTVGVTASPFFKVRNLIRDSVQVIGTSPISANVAQNISEGWKLTDPKSDSYFNLLAGGGTIHFGTMMEGSEAKRVQSLVESGVDNATILGDDHKVKAFYRKHIEPGITAYNELGNRGEAINRAALYDQLIKQGVGHAEASLMARDLMDFSMQGSFSSIRFLTQVVPFFNARIQGLYKLGRAAKEDPARFSAVIGASALASISLLVAFSDDDDWKKREDWDRNNFWWFKFGGTAFRIPKPFEIGAIATLAERGFEYAFDKEMTGERFRKQVIALLGDNLAMNPVPQFAKPIIDLYANKDGLTGSPIESMGMEKLKSEYRFNERTSMTARAASTTMNSVTGLIGVDSPSPVKLDHLLRGYFGWLGTFVIGVGDIIARPLTSQPSQPSRDMWKLITGNMISDTKDAPSRYVSQMYEQAKEIEQAYGTYRALVKQGHSAEAADFATENKDKIQKYKNIEHIKQGEAKINERIKLIERSNIDPDQKRDLIRSLKSQKDLLARRDA